MRVYLKNGRRIKVSVEVGTELAEMMTNSASTRENVLLTRHQLRMPDKNVVSLFDIDQIAAIK